MLYAITYKLLPTPEQATKLRQAGGNNRFLYNQLALERSIPISEPDEDIMMYSGQLELRIPRSLHKRLAQNAKEEGVSIDEYCTMLLSSLAEIQPYTG